MNFFKSSKSVKKGGRNSSKKSSIPTLESKRDGVMEKSAMDNAERELYHYDLPQQDLGMSDLIKNHESGTRFMYAAVTGKEEEEYSAKLRRLISFQPMVRKKAIPVDNLPVIKLYRETETYPLDQIIPKTKSKANHGDYLRISDAIVLYGAVVSPDCNFTKIQVGISDNRLLTNKMVKSFTATTNMMVRGNLSLPYCIPVVDADQLVLTISRERSFLEEGRQWGAIQIELILEFSMFPMQYDNQAVAAINMLPSTALETPINNPNNIDISILNQDRKKIAEIYLDGDVADENEPIGNKTEAVKYLKSTIQSAKRGKTLQSATKDWDFIKEKRVAIDADQNSIDPLEDGSLKFSDRDDESIEDNPPRPPTPPKRSSMKKTVKIQGEDPITMSRDSKTVSFDGSQDETFTVNPKPITPWG